MTGYRVDIDKRELLALIRKYQIEQRRVAIILDALNKKYSGEYHPKKGETR